MQSGRNAPDDVVTDENREHKNRELEHEGARAMRFFGSGECDSRRNHCQRHEGEGRPRPHNSAAHAAPPFRRECTIWPSLAIKVPVMTSSSHLMASFPCFLSIWGSRKA